MRLKVLSMYNINQVTRTYRLDIDQVKPATNDRQTVFINNRYVRDRGIFHAVARAYRMQLLWPSHVIC